MVATDRVLGDWTDGLQADGDRLLAMACDVRDEDSVDRAISVALDFAPIDTLVNNAGYAIFGTQERWTRVPCRSCSTSTLSDWPG